MQILMTKAARARLGERLAAESPADADLILGRVKAICERASGSELSGTTGFFS